MTRDNVPASLRSYPRNRVLRVLGAAHRKTLIVPIDDSLISGPMAGLSDMQQVLEKTLLGGPDAVLGFPAQFERLSSALTQGSLGWIMNLTASVVGERHTRKVQVHQVSHALRLGCDAVAAHVNLTSRHESEMIETLGKVVEAGRREGVPTLAIVYPRREVGDGRDDNYEALKLDDPDAFTDLIGRCIRLAADLGAGIVKTQYTGTVESFSRVCDCTPEIPVVAAGGPLLPRESALKIVSEIGASSAKGVSFGRNVYNRADIASFLGDVHKALGTRVS